MTDSQTVSRNHLDPGTVSTSLSRCARAQSKSRESASAEGTEAKGEILTHRNLLLTAYYLGTMYPEHVHEVRSTQLGYNTISYSRVSLVVGPC